VEVPAFLANRPHWHPSVLLQHKDTVMTGSAHKDAFIDISVQHIQLHVTGHEHGRQRFGVL
jgi:hypothetical protein